MAWVGSSLRNKLDMIGKELVLRSLTQSQGRLLLVQKVDVIGKDTIPVGLATHMLLHPLLSTRDLALRAPPQQLVPQLHLLNQHLLGSLVIGEFPAHLQTLIGLDQFLLLSLFLPVVKTRTSNKATGHHPLPGYLLAFSWLHFDLWLKSCTWKRLENMLYPFPLP